ncbi:transposase [Streptomyces kaniharaensis]|uniref:Transposase n=1 Tax=Streptomyces kaniharaensis TaxID=212423 RepID=A0A6N7KW22_9ACTN|nr:transposase [Streptomyces kaniharaensis]MQS14809.1 transposase [Streptomyces kaniharaensis]
MRFTRNGFRIRSNGKLNLAKIGDVRVKWSRSLAADPSSVTVVLDAAGRYHASFVVEGEPDPLPEVPAEIGIDLGLTTYAVLSDGSVIDNPRFLRKAEKKLKAAQRELSRRPPRPVGRRRQLPGRRRPARGHAAHPGPGLVRREEDVRTTRRRPCGPSAPLPDGCPVGRDWTDDR